MPAVVPYFYGLPQPSRCPDHAIAIHVNASDMASALLLATPIRPTPEPISSPAAQALQGIHPALYDALRATIPERRHGLRSRQGLLSSMAQCCRYRSAQWFCPTEVCFAIVDPKRTHLVSKLGWASVLWHCTKTYPYPRPIKLVGGTARLPRRVGARKGVCKRNVMDCDRTFPTTRGGMPLCCLPRRRWGFMQTHLARTLVGK